MDKSQKENNPYDVNFSPDLREHFMKVTLLSSKLEAYFAENDMFFSSEFMDNIASMIIYESRKDGKRTVNSHGRNRRINR